MPNEHESSEQLKNQNWSVSDVEQMMDRTEKGTIKQTITNIVTVLSYDPKLKDAIRNNEQTERKDIVKPMWWKRETSSMTDTDEAYITMYLEKTYGFCNEQKITKAIKIVANNNRYHPIQDKLNSLYSY